LTLTGSPYALEKRTIILKKVTKNSRIQKRFLHVSILTNFIL
jgi:hypothetical protein